MTPLRVVLFSGGRGAGTIVEALLADPRVSLTIAINGYDDGASTGEVRRFLGDALGPSDFRKSGGRAAASLATVPAEAQQLLDLRLPVDCPEPEARRLLAASGPPEPEWSPWSGTLLRLAASGGPAAATPPVDAAQAGVRVKICLSCRSPSSRAACRRPRSG